MSDKTITLATLKDATAQQVFDQVVDHLRKQGKQAYSYKNDSCNYRVVGLCGEILKCAAGCLIGDDEYSPEMDNNDEGTSWAQLVDRGQVPASHRELIRQLQNIHDGVITHWEKGFAEVALAYGLSYTPPA